MMNQNMVFMKKDQRGEDTRVWPCTEKLAALRKSKATSIKVTAATIQGAAKR